MIPIPFCGPAYKNDSLSISAQTCKNMYPELNGKDSKVVTALKPTPGTNLWVTLTGSGFVRKIKKTSNNRFFGVCGNVLSEVTADGTVTVRGALTTFQGRIDMADNGLELIVVDAEAGRGWILTFSDNTFVEITSSGYPGGSHVSFINQRFLVNKPETQQFYWSALADGFTWDGSFASAEGSPDWVNSMIAFRGEEWVFGDDSYEVFDNIGTGFSLIDGTHNDIGCPAVNSIAKTDNNVFWLAGDENGHGRVMTNEGYSPRAISDLSIEQAIQRYSRLDDAIGYCYQQLGHEFYVLSFPTANTTWVYDLSTNMWHERNYTNSKGVQSMHRGITQEFFNGKVYVGDWLSGNIYELDPDATTDNGDEIHRERACPHIWNNMDRAFYRSFQLDIEVGVGLTADSVLKTGTITTSTANPIVSGSGTKFESELKQNQTIIWTDDAGVYKTGVILTIDSDTQLILRANADSDSTTVALYLLDDSAENPQVMLDVSNDGGKTWGHEIWKPAGKIGEYSTRLIWNRMGSSRDRIFRIKMTDPVKWVVLGAYVDLV